MLDKIICFSQNKGLNNIYYEAGDKVNIILESKNEFDYIKKIFGEYFTKNNFKEEESLGLVGVDSTVLFTNSAITSLKKYIKGNIKIDSYFIIQKCIRVWNLDCKLEEYLKYSSSFSMLGAFVSEEEYDSFMYQIDDFLKELKISDDVIFVMDKKFQQLNRYWAKKDNKKYLDVEGQLDWSFGEGDIMTRNGISIRILDKITQEFTDIGNILEIQSKGETKAYGFGLGIETFLTRKNGYIHPSQVYIEYNNNSSVEIHLNDTIILLLDLYDNKIKLSNHKEGYQVKKSLKKLEAARKEMKISIFDLISRLKKIESNKFGKINYTKYILNDYLIINNLKFIKKEISILTDKNSNINNIISELNIKYNDLFFEFLYDFEGLQIGSGKKSITLSIYFLSKIGDEKQTFSNIVNMLKKDLILR